MSESDIMKRIQIWASRAGFRLWRNNVAKAYNGIVQRVSMTDRVTVYPGDIIIRKPRLIHAGLCPGSSDLIGVRPTLITESMIGQTKGIFTAIEVKTQRGRTTELQDNFIRAIEDMGGIARVARNTEDLKDLDDGQGRV